MSTLDSIEDEFEICSNTIGTRSSEHYRHREINNLFCDVLSDFDRNPKEIIYYIMPGFHKVYNEETKSENLIFSPFVGFKTVRIKELEDRHPRDISKQEFNLLLLKYMSLFK